MTLDIPEVVINRLPVYARALASLAMDGEVVVSSQALGERLDVTPAQIRKDLSYFGRFGKQGRGYNVQGLLTKLREILGLDRKWRVCLVGVGRLGQAIAEYGGFEPQGFQIVAVPAQAAQQVVDRLVNAGIRAILNYAPMLPHVPVQVAIRNIDPVLAMQSMTFHIKRHDPVPGK
ncbi:MAG: redox-sensing transcriptional repressor Rex [Dehalococcoidia bacterium]|nr:redox-sensing transcriptional repressor Rex [Dehalococcoidia bacterium]